MTLSGAAGAIRSQDGTGIGTITNDDAVAPTLTIADTAVAEGNAGTTTANFTVTLSAQPGSDARHRQLRDRQRNSRGRRVTTPRLPRGRSPSPGTTTTQTIPVTVVGDTAAEANETFTVTLSSPSAATLADGVATGRSPTTTRRRRR